MKRILPAIVLGAAIATGLLSCQDDMTTIGGSLTKGEVTITLDSLTLDARGSSEWVERYDSRTITKLLGRLAVPEYGSLECSFVSQMLSVNSLSIPDSIPEADVDSMRLLLGVGRGNLTGDSLTPQQLRVYRLPDVIPDTISSDFDPEKYYGSKGTLYGTRSYTLSNISMSDSVFKQLAYIPISVKLHEQGKDEASFAREVFRMYRNNDPVFAWPQSFNDWFHGLYVEQNFGNGCVGNISMMEAYIYWHRKQLVAENRDSNRVEYIERIVRDSVCVFAAQPEVVSSNNIHYTPAESLCELAAEKAVVTSPGGYIANIHFPVDTLLARYNAHKTELAVVSALTMSIPAKVVKNDYDIAQAPSILMVRKKDRDAFFRDNKIPDNITSFTADYNSTTGCYEFSGLRQYLINLLEDIAAGKPYDPADQEFSLIPVALTTESVKNPYTGSTTTYVLRCARYIGAPTMTELDTEHATVRFLFSTQEPGD